MVIEIVLWLVIGAVAGWGAAKVMRGHHFGIVQNIIIGIIGAVLGNAILHFAHIEPFIINWWITAIVVAFAGACLLLYVIPLILKK